MSEKNRLIVVLGFSASGKGTLLKPFVQNNSTKVRLIKSVTIRSQRSADNYYTFISHKAIYRLNDFGLLLEKPAMPMSGTEYSSQTLKMILLTDMCLSLELTPTVSSKLLVHHL